MDNVSNENMPKLDSKQSETNIFSNKNTIITVLVLLLVFSFLGINILMIFGDVIQRIALIFGPFFEKVLGTFGYTTGTVIDKTTDAAIDISKTGIDIAGGVAYNIGDLFKRASDEKKDIKIDLGLDLEKTVNKPSKKKEEKQEEAKPDTTTNPIQKPISSIKARWCLVGEYEGRRGCIAIADHDKCLSGQVFPTQQMCLNPTYTNNMQPSLKPIRV
jgi:hypothetical protein